MKIAVCIKQVPTREWQPRLNDDKTWIREQDASFEMNEPDAYALEEALRLQGEARRRGRRLLGRAGARRAGASARRWRAAPTARSTSRTTRSASADAFVVADALAAAMTDEQFDLVLTGLQSDDQGFAQIGVDPRRAARPAARDDHHGSAGRRTARCA